MVTFDITDMAGQIQGLSPWMTILAKFECSTMKMLVYREALCVFMCMYCINLSLFVSFCLVSLCFL